MKLTPLCDPYRDGGNHAKYVVITDRVIQELINQDMLDAELNIIGSAKKIIRCFFENDLDVYIDNDRYCSDCRRKCKENSNLHCHKCNQCKPSSEFHDACILKHCDACKIKIYKKYGPPNGWGIIYASYPIPPFAFKLHPWMMQSK